jgi:hypothetical protein
MDHSGIGHVRNTKVQRLKPSQTFNMDEAGMRHAGFEEPKVFEPLQVLEMGEAGVRHARTGKVQRLKLNEPLASGYAGVGISYDRIHAGKVIVAEQRSKPCGPIRLLLLGEFPVVKNGSVESIDLHDCRSFAPLGFDLPRQ